ncbi:MAG: site-2 protease family protein [Ruminococcaceae bacterium]|nr:site-2 protease family protein [Oscillospiraceae bacterium]
MFTREGILSLILSIPGLLLAIIFHEFAHGWAAYLMGDNTARYSGRLSLNPLHHLDPVGALCMLLFRFGWAKPVPINPNNFKNHRKGVIIVSLAGPFANFVIGLISWILAYASQLLLGTVSSFAMFLVNIFVISGYMNVGLMVFNLIPIPPLDGSKILLEFLPYRWQYKIYQYERYFSLILLLLVYGGTMTPVLSVIRSYVIAFYELVAQGIFGLII